MRSLIKGFKARHAFFSGSWHAAPEVSEMQTALSVRFSSSKIKEAGDKVLFVTRTWRSLLLLL